jgi:hypothetical protein
MMGFKTRDFFDVDAAESAAVNKPVDVDFSADSKAEAKK